MLGFMFGVLGSVIFWVVFFVVGFVAGSISFKHCAPLSYKVFKTGEAQKDTNFGGKVYPLGSSVIFLFNVVFWPIITTFFILNFVIGKALWPMMRKGVEIASNIIPEFEIKTKKEKDND